MLCLLYLSVDLLLKKNNIFLKVQRLHFEGGQVYNYLV